MTELQETADWPKIVEVVLSAEVGGRRVTTSHVEQAKAAAQAAFTASLTGHPTPYTLSNVRTRCRYFYLGLDTDAEV